MLLATPTPSSPPPSAPAGVCRRLQGAARPHGAAPGVLRVQPGRRCSKGTLERGVCAIERLRSMAAPTVPAAYDPAWALLTVQGQAEHYLEKLHHKVEKDLSKFLKGKPAPGQLSLGMQTRTQRSAVARPARHFCPSGLRRTGCVQSARGLSAGEVRELSLARHAAAPPLLQTPMASPAAAARAAPPRRPAAAAPAAAAPAAAATRRLGTPLGKRECVCV